jgi:hypothetical protein
MLAKLVLSLALLAAAGSSASDSLPKAGSYGFNWLDPESAECREISVKDIAAMKSCTGATNAFGIDLPSKACRVDDQVELIVYDTREHCQQGLETMQANAP